VHYATAARHAVHGLVKSRWLAGSGSQFSFANARKPSKKSGKFGGANVLPGGGGNDHIYGLGGRDTLTGDSGEDTFFFLKLSDSGTKAEGRDLITDFVPGAGELIELNAMDANGNAAGEGVFDFIGFSHFSGVRASCGNPFARATRSSPAT
jgi:hypothetical protein